MLGLDHEPQEAVPSLVPIARRSQDIHDKDAVGQAPTVAERHEALILVHVLRAKILVLLDEPGLARSDDQPLHPRLNAPQVSGLPQCGLHQWVGAGSDYESRHFAPSSTGNPFGNLDELFNLKVRAARVVNDAHRSNGSPRKLVFAQEY